MYELALLVLSMRTTWLLIAVVLTALTFALFAFAFDRTGRTVIAALLEATTWLFGVAVIVILATLFAAATATWLLIAGVLTALTFALLAFAFSCSGRTTVAAIFAAGAWLFWRVCRTSLVLAPVDAQRASNENLSGRDDSRWGGLVSNQSGSIPYWPIRG